MSSLNLPYEQRLWWLVLCCTCWTKCRGCWMLAPELPCTFVRCNQKNYKKRVWMNKLWSTVEFREHKSKNMILLRWVVIVDDKFINELYLQIKNMILLRWVVIVDDKFINELYLAMLVLVDMPILSIGYWLLFRSFGYCGPHNSMGVWNCKCMGKLKLHWLLGYYCWVTGVWTWARWCCRSFQNHWEH